VDEADITAREAGLVQGLSRGQIVMMGLGGAIGTGLFMGSGIAIGYAGPAVVISYLIAAFAAMAVVLSLSEMAVMHPAAGSFGTYAETYLNPWAGFTVRYTYWMCEVVAVGGEAVAAGRSSRSQTRATWSSSASTQKSSRWLSSAISSFSASSA
jgi:AAT family amino acid transporter